MKTVQEIEKELQEAKNQQKLDYLQKELEDLKNCYEGKAFGSCTFEARNKQAYGGARFYEKFWIEDYKIRLIEWSISVHRVGRNYSFSQDSLDFRRNRQEKISEDNGYNAHYNLIGYCFYKKEISVNKFMELWSQGEAITEQLFEVYKKSNTELPTTLIVSESDEKILSDAFTNLKLEVVDLKDYPDIEFILRFKNLPFFQDQRYLPKIYAKQILKYQIDLWWQEYKEPYNIRNKDYIYKKIRQLEDFIKTI